MNISSRNGVRIKETSPREMGIYDDWRTKMQWMWSTEGLSSNGYDGGEEEDGTGGLALWILRNVTVWNFHVFPQCVNGTEVFNFFQGLYRQTVKIYHGCVGIVASGAESLHPMASSCRELHMRRRKNIDADRSRASGIWACLRMKDLQTAYLFCMEHPELQASGVLIFFSTYSGTLLQCLLSFSLLGTCQMQSITQHLSLSISCSAIGWWFKVFQYIRIEALACH